MIRIILLVTFLFVSASAWADDGPDYGAGCCLDHSASSPPGEYKE